MGVCRHVCMYTYVYECMYVCMYVRVSGSMGLCPKSEHSITVRERALYNCPRVGHSITEQRVGTLYLPKSWTLYNCGSMGNPHWEGRADTDKGVDEKRQKGSLREMESLASRQETEGVSLHSEMESMTSRKETQGL